MASIRIPTGFSTDGDSSNRGLPSLRLSDGLGYVIEAKIIDPRIAQRAVESILRGTIEGYVIER